MVGLGKVWDWLGFFFVIGHSLLILMLSSASIAPLEPFLQGHQDLWVLRFCLDPQALTLLLSSSPLFPTVFLPVFFLPSCFLTHLFTAAILGSVDAGSGLLFLLCILSLSNLTPSNIYHFVNFQYQSVSWAPDLHMQVPVHNTLNLTSSDLNPEGILQSFLSSL